MHHRPFQAGLLVLSVVLCANGCASLSERNPFPKMFGGKAEDSERLVSLARLEERHGKYAESEAILKRVLEVDPQNVAAHHRMGVIAVREGRVDEGLASLQLAQTASKKPSAELLTDLGYCWYLKNDSQAAERCLREALTLDPRSKRAHNNLGIIYGERGDFDASLAEFRQAGSEAEARANLAYVQTRFGNLGEAEKNYHAALAADGNLRSAAEALVQITELRAKAEGTALPPQMPKTNIAYQAPVMPASFSERAAPTKNSTTNTTSQGATLLPGNSPGAPQRMMSPAPPAAPTLPGGASNNARLSTMTPASTAPNAFGAAPSNLPTGVRATPMPMSGVPSIGP